MENATRRNLSTYDKYAHAWEQDRNKALISTREGEDPGFLMSFRSSQEREREGAPRPWNHRIHIFELGALREDLA